MKVETKQKHKQQKTSTNGGNSTQQSTCLVVERNSSKLKDSQKNTNKRKP